jgi:hypothetical protein
MFSSCTQYSAVCVKELFCALAVVPDGCCHQSEECPYSTLSPCSGQSGLSWAYSSSIRYSPPPTLGSFLLGTINASRPSIVSGLRFFVDDWSWSWSTSGQKDLWRQDRDVSPLVSRVVYRIAYRRYPSYTTAFPSHHYLNIILCRFEYNIIKWFQFNCC